MQDVLTGHSSRGLQQRSHRALGRSIISSGLGEGRGGLSYDGSGGGDNGGGGGDGGDVSGG